MRRILFIYWDKESNRPSKAAYKDDAYYSWDTNQLYLSDNNRDWVLINQVTETDPYIHGQSRPDVIVVPAGESAVFADSIAGADDINLAGTLVVLPGTKINPAYFETVIRTVAGAVSASNTRRLEARSDGWYDVDDGGVSKLLSAPGEIIDDVFIERISKGFGAGALTTVFVTAARWNQFIWISPAALADQLVFKSWLPQGTYLMEVYHAVFAVGASVATVSIGMTSIGTMSFYSAVSAYTGLTALPTFVVSSDGEYTFTFQATTTGPGGDEGMFISGVSIRKIS